MNKVSVFDIKYLKGSQFVCGWDEKMVRGEGYLYLPTKKAYCPEHYQMVVKKGFKK